MAEQPPAPSPASSPRACSSARPSKHCRQRAELLPRANKGTAGVEREEEARRNTYRLSGGDCGQKQRFAEAGLPAMPRTTCTASRENAPGWRSLTPASPPEILVSESPRCLQPFVCLTGKVEGSTKEIFLNVEAPSRAEGPEVPAACWAPSTRTRPRCSCERCQGWSWVCLPAELPPRGSTPRSASN